MTPTNFQELWYIIAEQELDFFLSRKEQECNNNNNNNI